MITPTALLIATALLSGAAGFAVTPLVRRYLDRESRPVSRWPLAGMAAAAGAGAAALTSGWAELITFAVLGIGAAALLLLDLSTLRLPDPVVGALYLVLVVGLGIQAAADGDWTRWLISIAGGAAMLVSYFVLGLIGAGRLGLGDVKLSGVLGVALAWLGPAQVLLGALAGFAVAGVVSVALLATGSATRRSSYPFGPCMIIGAVVGASLGPAVPALLG